MIDQIKYYLIQVGLKKYTPVAVMSVLTSLGTLFMAHEGMLESWGVNYIPDLSQLARWMATHPTSGPGFLVELDTTSTAAIAAIIGLITLMSRAGEHHTIGATNRVEGGRRPDDPPAATPPQEIK